MIDDLGFALNFNGYAGGCVGDQAGEAAFVGETINKRAKADTLDKAGDVDGFAHYNGFAGFLHLEIIAESSGIDSRGRLLTFVLKRIEPAEPQIETIADAGRERDGFHLGMDFSGVFRRPVRD